MSDHSAELPTSLSKPLLAFYEYLRSERGLSLYTQRNYKQHLEEMALQLAELNVLSWKKLMLPGFVS